MPAKMFEGKIPTPNGLQELMFGFTREIIKNRPENIIEFAAEHFEKLLLIREQAKWAEGVKKISKESSKMTKVETEVESEVDGETEPKLTAIEDKTDQKALNKSLETTGHMSKYDRTVAAVVLIQKTFRNYKQRQLGNLQKPSVCDELPHQRGEMEKYDTTDSDETSTFSSAATKIQANVRGYLVRKSLAKNTSDATIAPSMSLDEGDNLKDIVEEKENLLLESGKVFEGEYDSIRSDNLEKINEEVEIKSEDNVANDNEIIKDNNLEENTEVIVDSVSRNTVENLTGEPETILTHVEINNPQETDIKNDEIEISDQHKNINEHKINMDDLSNDVKNTQQVISVDENKIIDADKVYDDENQEKADVSNENSTNLEQVNITSSAGGENIDAEDAVKNESNASNSSIDLSDKNVEGAAITIQHSYRVYRSRTLRREDAVQSTTSSEETSGAVNDKGDKEITDDEDADNFVPRDYVAATSKQNSEEKKTSIKENDETEKTKNEITSENSEAYDTRAKLIASSTSLVQGTGLNNIKEEDEDDEIISTTATRDYVAGNKQSIEGDNGLKLEEEVVEHESKLENDTEKNALLLESNLNTENQTELVKNVEDDKENEKHELSIEEKDDKKESETAVESTNELEEINDKEDDSDEDELTGGKSFISRDYVSLENEKVILNENKDKNDENYLKEDENNKDNTSDDGDDETIENNYISRDYVAPQTGESVENIAAVESNEHRIRKRSALSEIIDEENNEAGSQESNEDVNKKIISDETGEVVKRVLMDDDVDISDNKNEIDAEENITENQDKEDINNEVLSGSTNQENRDYVDDGGLNIKDNVESSRENKDAHIPENKTELDNASQLVDEEETEKIDKNENLAELNTVENKIQDNIDIDNDEELPGKKVLEARDYKDVSSSGTKDIGKVTEDDNLEKKEHSVLENETQIIDQDKVAEIDKNDDLTQVNIKENENRESDKEDTDDDILKGSTIQASRDYIGVGSLSSDDSAKTVIADTEKEEQSHLETKPEVESMSQELNEVTKEVEEMNKNKDSSEESIKEQDNNNDTDDEILTGSKLQATRDYLVIGDVSTKNTAKLNEDDILEKKDHSLIESKPELESGSQIINEATDANENFTEMNIEESKRIESENIDNENSSKNDDNAVLEKKELNLLEVQPILDSENQVVKEEENEQIIVERKNQGSDDTDTDDEELTGNKNLPNRDYLGVSSLKKEDSIKDDNKDIIEEKKLTLLTSKPEFDVGNQDVDEENNTDILKDLSQNNEDHASKDALENEPKNDMVIERAANEGNIEELNEQSTEINEDDATKELSADTKMEESAAKQMEIETSNIKNDCNLERANQKHEEHDNASKEIEKDESLPENVVNNDMQNHDEEKNNEESKTTEGVGTAAGFQGEDVDHKIKAHEGETNSSTNELTTNENEVVNKEDVIDEPEAVIKETATEVNDEPGEQVMIEKKIKVDENDNETNEGDESDDEELKGSKTIVNRDYVAELKKDPHIVESFKNDQQENMKTTTGSENNTDSLSEHDNLISEDLIQSDEKDSKIANIESGETVETKNNVADSGNDHTVANIDVKEDMDAEELYGGQKELQRDYTAGENAAASRDNNSISNDSATEATNTDLERSRQSPAENITHEEESNDSENHNVEKRQVGNNSQENVSENIENHTNENNGITVESQDTENNLLENGNENENNASDIDNVESHVVYSHIVENPNDNDVNYIAETVENHVITENVPHENSITNYLTYTNHLNGSENVETNDHDDTDETENLFSLDSLNEIPINKNLVNHNDFHDNHKYENGLSSIEDNPVDGNDEVENVIDESHSRKSSAHNDSDEEELSGGRNYVTRDYVIKKSIDEERMKHVKDQIEKLETERSDEVKVPENITEDKTNLEEGLVENSENNIEVQENEKGDGIFESQHEGIVDNDKSPGVVSPTSSEKRNSIESILKRDYIAKLGTLKKSLSDTSDKMSKNIEVNDEKMIIKSINTEIENKIVNLSDIKNIKGDNARPESVPRSESVDKDNECAGVLATTPNEDLPDGIGMTSSQHNDSAQASNLSEEISTRTPRISRETGETSMNELDAVSVKQAITESSSENKSAAKQIENSEKFAENQRKVPEAANDFKEKELKIQELDTKENLVDLLPESSKIDPKLLSADQIDHHTAKIGQKVSEIDQNFTNLIDSDSQEDMNSKENAAAKIQAGFRGYKVRKQMRRDQEIVSNQFKKSPKRNGSLEERSATKIQAGVRGFLVRRKHNKAKEAATKIQASFRGFKTRKAMKKNGEV